MSMVSFELLLRAVFLDVTSHIFSLARVCEFHRAIWPGLLEAWLVLTSVKYHGNLYILISLNQRLALTRLRATGPCKANVRYNRITNGISKRESIDCEKIKRISK